MTRKRKKYIRRNCEGNHCEEKKLKKGGQEEGDLRMENEKKEKDK